MMGGLPSGHRDLIDNGPYGIFEKTIEKAIGKRVRASQEDAEDLWAALANVDWFGPNGEEIGYSFRAAGDFCAALREDEGEMTYMIYYCSKPHGNVADWIADAMATEGWRYEEL